MTSSEPAAGAPPQIALGPEFDPLGPAAGNHGERLARGALLQQGAQIIRLIGGLVVVTVLAHRLSFSALGTYTILISMITYVMFVKSSVMNAAVVGIAKATAERDRGRIDVVVSTGLSIYVLIGLVSGGALCAIGLLVLPSLHIPAGLYHEARIGVIGLAAATALSWPVQIFDDLLRGMQRFSAVSCLEIFGMVVYMAGALVLVFLGAPVWALVTWNASIPLLQCLACLVALPLLGIRVRVDPRLVERGELRRFGSFSGLLTLSGVAELAIYSVDRFALSAFRSPAAVGRYEGPLGAQNMIRYLNGVLSAPVIPIATAFFANHDTERVRELFLRGQRYCYAATVPLSVTMVVYAAPILKLWLGDRFGSTGTAASIFCAWWIVGANSGMVTTMLIASGRIKRLVVNSWLAGAVNGALVFTITERFGLYGPIVASLCAFAASMAFTLPYSMRLAGAGWRDSLREAWWPALSLGAVLGAVLWAARWELHLVGGPATLAVVLIAPVLYWLAYAVVFLTDDERHLALYALHLRASRGA